MTTQQKQGTDGNASHNMPFSRIMVPIDFSDGSQRIVECAASLSKLVRPRVRLLHVINTLLYNYEYTYMPIDLIKVREETSNRLQQFIEQNFTSIDADFEVIEGSPSREITQAAISFGADLIIMGSHGYTGLKRVLIGSTAERVVRHAICPVLVIRSDDSKAEQG